MRTKWLALMAMMIGFRPPPALAQPGPVSPAAPPRVFLSAGVMAHADRTWPDPMQVLAGLTAVAGVDLSPHVGVRLTFDMPRVASATSPARTFQNTSGSFRSMIDKQYRTSSWSVLVDRHGQVSDRVRVGFVTGITVTHRSLHYHTSTDELAADGAIVRHTDSRMDYPATRWAVTIGAELALSLSDHLVLVPAAHTIWLIMRENDEPFVQVLRPGLSLRWRF